MEIFIQKFLEHYDLKAYIEWAKTIASVLEFFLAVVLFGIVKYFWNSFQEYQLSKNLSPFWEKSDIVKYTKYFIPTRAQDISPSEKEELKDSHKHYASNHLIPYFLENALVDKDENKYYLILADTGMGKTAFMVNLYLAYRRQKIQFWKINFWKNLFFGLNEIQLFPLGRPDVLEKIDLIEKAKRKNTILLLDAFDEDTEAIKDYENRMKEIVEKTQDFHDIIITCRTQFFPSEKAEPSETGIMRFGSEKGHYEFFKKYISPFSEKDIKLFLRKRYGVLKFWNYFKKKRAKRIIEQVPNLRVRPMLLSYIDDLLISESKFYYTYEIYEELIRKWVKREANNYKKDKRDSFEEQLNLFSRKIAIDMYLKREERNGFFIDGNSIGVFAIEHNIDLSAMELKGRSLLNRNVQGYYKFAHKSILEYYLAIELYDNESFRENFQFESMSFAKELYQEMFFVKNVVPEIEEYDPKLYALIRTRIDKININNVHSLYKKIKVPENSFKEHLIGLDYLFNRVSEKLKTQDKVREYMLRGLDCSDLKNPWLDIQNFTKVIELEPKYSQAYYYRGQAYFDLKNNQKAIDDFTKAIELKPNNVIAYSDRGRLYIELKEYQSAIQDFSRIIQMESDYSSAYYNRGVAYSKLGQKEKAIEDYDSAIRINPNFVPAYFKRGVVYSDLGQAEKAIADYDSAIRIDPNFVSAYFNRGVIYSDIGQAEKAIEDYDNAIRIEPDFASAYYNRGVVYSDIGQAEKAIEDYDNAIRIEPDFASAYYNRGVVYADIGQTEKAIADYDNAIKLNPELADSYHNRGKAYSDLGQNKKAIADYDNAIKFNPELAMAYNNRGIIYFDLGQNEKAIEDYDMAIQLDLNYASPYYNRGNMYKTLKQYEKAIEDFTKAITINPTWGRAFFKRALTYANAANYDLSILDYQKCIELNPEKPSYYSNLSQILFILNRDEEAIKSLNKAFSLKPTDSDLLSELWFYTFAHIPERRQEAKTKLQELIDENIREKGADNPLSPDWDLSKNIEKAIRDGHRHPEPDLLKEFARKISGKGNDI